MKNLLFLILAVLTLNLRLSTLNCFAQTLERQVISSSGGEYSNINLNLNFTVGEAVTETFGNTSLILTQGFQQPKQDTLFITLDSLNNINCFNGNNEAI